MTWWAASRRAATIRSCSISMSSGSTTEGDSRPSGFSAAGHLDRHDAATGGTGDDLLGRLRLGEKPAWADSRRPPKSPNPEGTGGSPLSLMVPLPVARRRTRAGAGRRCWWRPRRQGVPAAPWGRCTRPRQDQGRGHAGRVPPPPGDRRPLRRHPTLHHDGHGNAPTEVGGQRRLDVAVDCSTPSGARRWGQRSGAAPRRARSKPPALPLAADLQGAARPAPPRVQAASSSRAVGTRLPPALARRRTRPRPAAPADVASPACATLHAPPRQLVRPWRSRDQIRSCRARTLRRWVQRPRAPAPIPHPFAGGRPRPSSA